MMDLSKKPLFWKKALQKTFDPGTFKHLV